MSERPTPETDDAQWGTGKVTTDFARRLERERDEARTLLNQKAILLEIANRESVMLKKERDEARQGLRLMAQNAELWKERAENAFGVKVSDCLYDYDKKSAQLREATFKARHLQDLTQKAWQEVEKIENQEESK